MEEPRNRLGLRWLRGALAQARASLLCEETHLKSEASGGCTSK